MKNEDKPILPEPRLDHGNRQWILLAIVILLALAITAALIYFFTR